MWFPTRSNFLWVGPRLGRFCERAQQWIPNTHHRGESISGNIIHQQGTRARATIKIVPWIYPCELTNLTEVIGLILLERLAWEIVRRSTTTSVSSTKRIWGIFKVACLINQQRKLLWILEKWRDGNMKDAKNINEKRNIGRLESTSYLDNGRPIKWPIVQWTTLVQRRTGARQYPRVEDRYLVGVVRRA
jgi:hypothetical protein